MKFLLILSFSAAIVAGESLAQTPDAAVWRPDGPRIAESLSPVPQFIQQEMGRSRDRDRTPSGARMNRDEDDDRDEARGHGRAGELSGGAAGPLAQGHPAMRPPMGGMMGLGGARFHMRKGDAAIDVRCPSDTRFNDCVEAVGRLLDRLGAMGAASGPR